jgi:hypothetical protein
MLTHWTKLHQRLLTPTLDSLEAALRPLVAVSAHPLDHALTRLNASFDDLARADRPEIRGMRLRKSSRSKPLQYP